MRNRNWKLALLSLMMLVVIALPITVKAEPVYIESMGITVNLKDQPTETMVDDMCGILTKGDMEAVKAEGKRLGVYYIGLYIEMVDKETCTQMHARKLAESMCKDFMPKENSIMIVFSFYEEAEGEYAVYSYTQGDVSVSRIENIIDGTYHDFKTDSSWIAGSFNQVVSYLTEVEYNLIHADEIAAQKEVENKEFLRVMHIVLDVFLFFIIVLLIFKLKQNEDFNTSEINSLEKEKRSLEKKCSRKDEENSKLKAEKDALHKWKKNAIKADPQIEEKITTYLAQRKAEGFSNKYKDAEDLERLAEMMETYDKMSDKEKSYVTIDVQAGKEKLDALAKQKAAEATIIIEEACKKSDDRHNLDSYNNTVHYYNGLPLCVRILIAQSIIHSLTSRQQNAQADHSRHSYSTYHHSSSSGYSGGSSYGGFHSSIGGHSFHGGH